MNQPPPCPGCGARSTAGTFNLPHQPVVLNYRFSSAAKAQAVPRRDLTLNQCAVCGLVYNASFDPRLIPYDARYENRQCFSPAFHQYVEELAAGLIRRHGLRGGRVLEIGCGKGDFLRLLCRLAGARGEGYDTTYEGPASALKGTVRFHARYLTAADLRGRFDIVVCRHVIEHLPNIGAFLREWRAVARAAGDPEVVIETPSWEWIVERGCFWDIFYEHCNYLSLPTLAFLARRAGFKVARHAVVFGGQYQLLELKAAKEPNRPMRGPGRSADTSLQRFGQKVAAARAELEGRLSAAGAQKGWAIWGAGAKGVALVNQLTFRPPDFLVDTNPAKHGCFVPGSKVPIVPPQDARVLTTPVILVANPNYLDEIRAQLAARGFRHRLLAA